MVSFVGREGARWVVVAHGQIVFNEFVHKWK